MSPLLQNPVLLLDNNDLSKESVSLHEQIHTYIGEDEFVRIYMCIYIYMSVGFPGGSVVKNPPASS